MAELHELAGLGQTVWLDYVRRSFIQSGDLQALVDDGLTGVTSNPSIFEKAIAGSTDYDDALHRLVDAGKDAGEIYETLVLEDIQRAADLLRPVYERTGGADGYVSLEVSPELAHDTKGTIAEARHLFAALDRPNVMIKVPATPAGIPAIETLIGEGININVTLMFSVSQYQAVSEAYINGVERLAASGGDVTQVASVASFFVSRVDTAVDRALERIGETEPQGKIAIANAKVAYGLFRKTFSGPRWESLAMLGARVQRPLWASTSTKNPLYPDTLYVDNLIGPDTVNTLPPATLQAFLDHGSVAPTIEANLKEAHAQLERLSDLHVDLDAITQRLLGDGVEAFAKSFKTLMASITEKCERLRAGWQHQSATLGSYQQTVDSALAEMAENRVVKRIWAHDHTVWKPEPAEIGNRLGWLHTAELMSDNVYRIEALTEAVHSDGYTHALLLGMGGSSLAPEVFRKTFGVAEGYLDLSVLDSTDPGAVLAHAEGLDPTRTLFIVATKSGTTVETLSLFKFFYNRVGGAVGAQRAGEHFVAITDPLSPLADLASQHTFRATFLNDPNIGGRYSALSYFGLVPAALLGVDVPRLLDRALTSATACEGCVAAEDNPGAWLGAILGELATARRDKLTLIASPAIASFGNWVEQLIAESTGKEGQGILPVVGEPMGSPAVYGVDRLFVHLRLDHDETHDAALAALEGAGYPVACLHLHDPYDLGGQFFLWEMATAVAGHRLNINPFDQPNVEAAKALARQMVAEYTARGTLPSVESSALTAEALNEFLSQAQPHDYVALQAYVQPTGETDAALLALRARLRDRLRLATTVGYGPRYLHSTGQLHKGDGGHGLFIQFTCDDEQDIPIPEVAGASASSISFGVLKAAQALGDHRALLNAGRRVIRFHLGSDVIGGLRKLSEMLS
ncbi:MAG: transaldolase [Chloroflexi bacterium B3_Chlor]|nr:MAG: transaldolase [Chloroflexi bacterium B3_Chlor]